MRSRYSRNLLSVGMIVIMILIILNILSTSPPTEPSSMTPGLVVESSHEFDKLTKEIENLKTMDAHHQTQISTLKDTVQRLQEQIKNNVNHPHIKPQTNNKNAINSKSYKPEKPQLNKPKLASSFVLIPESDILYPEITISNIGISDTPSSPKSIIKKDINNNNVIYERDNGIIHGNPLLISKCSNALTTDHELNVLSSISYHYNNFVPWFWSRESIGSVLQNKKFNSHSNILTSDTFDNSTNAIYVKIDNNAAGIMQNTLLKSTNLLQTINAPPNARMQSKCGFTFVQHPITRFIEGYFRVNALLWNEFDKIEHFPDIFEQFTFYKIVGDLRGRLKAFINDLRKFHYSFVLLFPWMNILMTQVGQLSVSQNDINHIFKYEFIQSEYQNILNDPNDEFCIDESDHFEFNDNAQINMNNMEINNGVDKQYLFDQQFREWIGLKIELNDMKIEDLMKMDILYIYDVMDYELYSKIVEYYWQDFVCFDYAADYKHDVLDYLTKFQDKYPGFPVENRTKTNWDKILEFYYSKQNRQRAGFRGI